MRLSRSITEIMYTYKGNFFLNLQGKNWETKDKCIKRIFLQFQFLHRMDSLTQYDHTEDE